MSGFPKDIDELINMFVKPEFKDVAQLIRLRAELDERERCAKIADEWEGPEVLLPLCNDKQNEIARVGMTEASLLIADAIRDGSR